MSLPAGVSWTGIGLVVLLAVVVVGLLLRYRALERAGTPLPPGAGGARLVGVRATVVADHVPGSRRGQVLALGERWGVADRVAQPLRAGDDVIVEEVTGTRLVVAPAPRVEESTSGPARAPHADTEESTP